MTSRRRHALIGALAIVPAATMLGCAPIEETVFAPLGLEPGPPLVFMENAGTVDVRVRLRAAPTRDVALGYRVLGIEAQDDCPVPDFEAAEGRVDFPAGTIESSFRLWVGDDDLAETDERLEIVFYPLPGDPALASGRLEVSIADDDRSGFVDARDHGVVPNARGDQASELASALLAAAALGRGVVVLEPGDYEISSVALPPGVTLSGRGARWHRPPSSAPEIVALRIEHAGAADSSLSLVEGLTIDGRRDEQGPYRGDERDTAHLVVLAGQGEEGGRVRSTLERTSLLSGTASGVWIGPNADVTVCGLTAGELWRDAITVVGGNSSARLWHVDATASQGTGLWLGVRDQGHEGSLALEVDVDNVRIGAGDVELEATVDSRLTLRRLTMTGPPFRLDAPGGVVRIADSVLMMGLPSELHSYFGLAHDVEISGSTLVVTETLDSGMLEEQARTFAAVSISAMTTASGGAADGMGRLRFDGCRFELGSDVEPDDTVVAIDNPNSELSIVLHECELAAGFADWFAPGCSNCSIEP